MWPPCRPPLDMYRTRQGPRTAQCGSPYLHLEVENTLTKSRAAYHYSIFNIDIDTDIGTAFWYRYQFDPYHDPQCNNIDNNIAQRKNILDWKGETCDQEHCTQPTTTACAVIMRSGYNSGDLHGAAWAVFTCKIVSFYWNILVSYS